MTMKVNYDAATNHALFHADENSKVASKSLIKIASGIKINSVSENPASFSISESMKVKLRALEQDNQNVQNGSSILSVAEGGIANQIDLLRIIRARVVDATNDSHTYEDRQTIQKEINALYDEIESIAYQTQYKSIRPLIGNSKMFMPTLDTDYESSLNLIPDNYDILDDVTGPFDIFSEYAISPTPLEKIANYIPKVMSMDFSGYNNASELNNVGFKVGSTTYVLTDDTSKNYRGANSEININGCTSVRDVMNKIKNKFGSNATIDGTKVNIVTTSIGRASGPDEIVTSVSRVPHTGPGAGISGTTSGGVTNDTGDVDIPPAAHATLTVDLSEVASNSGFKFNGTNFRVIDEGDTTVGTVNRTLTKGKNSTGSTGDFNYTFDGGSLTFTSKIASARYNGYSITDGYTYYTDDGPTSTTVYTAYSEFGGDIATVHESSPAAWKLDVSNMSVDEFSKKYAGKTLQFGNAYYKFYDSTLAPKVEGLAEDSGSREYQRNQKQIDIDTLRQVVKNGTSLAQALKTKTDLKSNSAVKVDGDSLIFTNNSDSTAANIVTETIRRYDIDFSPLEGNVRIPKSLYGKGFRAYCATDDKEWFNFVFTDGTNNYTSNEPNIKSINIDVSRVRTVNDLVHAIYEQSNEILSENNPDTKYNHHMRVAADFDNNIITVYDHRRFNVKGAPYVYQELGAKIADGVLFDNMEYMSGKDFFVRDFVIQDTDTADMNIRIKIPQMTLDKIFNDLPYTNTTIYDYSVTDKNNCYDLLGTKKNPGILDMGLKYMLEAAALVGAQNKRLQYSAENITSDATNVTAANSVLNDTDIAREMTKYAKHNILTRASQTMLAQANQSRSRVISLLTDEQT